MLVSTHHLARLSPAGASGAAIAPPPSLTDSRSASADQHEQDQDQQPMSMVQRLASMPAQKTGLGVAAKIMAKYGYKVRDQIPFVAPRFARALFMSPRLWASSC